MLPIQCFSLLLQIKSLFKACNNAAKNVAFPAKNFKIFLGEGVPPLNAFGVSMSLPKTNPP